MADSIETSRIIPVDLIRLATIVKTYGQIVCIKAQSNESDIDGTRKLDATSALEKVKVKPMQNSPLTAIEKANSMMEDILEEIKKQNGIDTSQADLSLMTCNLLLGRSNSSQLHDNLIFRFVNDNLPSLDKEILNRVKAPIPSKSDSQKHASNIKKQCDKFIEEIAGWIHTKIVQKYGDSKPPIIESHDFRACLWLMQYYKDMLSRCSNAKNWEQKASIIAKIGKQKATIFGQCH